METFNSFYQIRNFKRDNLEPLNLKGYLIPPPDALIERQIIPLNKPKFGKNIQIINLSEFQNNNNTSESFILNKREKIQIIDKECSFDFYINSIKMINKLIYCKENYENNKITCDNIINLREFENTKKNKKKSKKNEKLKTEELIKKNNFNLDETLIFESKFESGNLQLVYLTEKSTEENLENDKYELFLTNDSNTTGYTQWFFFRVSNTKKNKKVNFQIMNLLRKKSKYQNGIKIWYYSQKENNEKKIGWHHTNEEVKYYRNNLFRIIKNQKQYYYTLSFNFTFKYDNDTIFFANSIPFTYTDLMKDLNYYTKYENSKYPFFHRKTLCQSLLGNDLDYITINNSNLNNNNSEIKRKEGIILMARQHPSETVSSWTIKGAIEFLMNESDEAKYLRDNFIFKIIPMINIDGVILGNSRTSISGCDLNRRWKQPNYFLHPEIYYCKDLIKNFYDKIKINCIVDFHGHFGAFNSFFYANHRKDNFSSGKFFPFISAKKSKIISFEKSIFSMPKYKKGTGRINLFHELDIDNIVTLETSYFGCNIKDYSNKYFTIDNLKEIGRDICIGILYLYYYQNYQIGINSFINYPNLKKKIESNFDNDIKDFENYINKKEKKIKNENNISNQSDNNSSINDKNKDELFDDDDDPNENESNSESEPSGDNLDIEEIKKLLPINDKNKKRLKKKKYNKKNNIFQKLKYITKKNLMNNIINLNNNKENQNLNDNNLNEKENNNENNNNNNNTNNNYNNNNNYNQNINIDKNNNNLTLTLPKIINNNIFNQNQLKLKTQIKKENNDINNNNNIIEKNNEYEKIIPKNLSSIETINNNLTNNTDNNLNTLKNKNNNKTTDSSTQTEEIFFKMPWTYFAGSYKIISSKVKNINLNRTMVPNILLQKFGIQKKKQMKSYRNGFYSSNFFNDNYNNNYNNYNKNDNDLDTKDLMNILTFVSFDNKRNHNNNIYYNSLTEKNKNQPIYENSYMKSMEIKKK